MTLPFAPKPSIIRQITVAFSVRRRLYLAGQLLGFAQSLYPSYNIFGYAIVTGKCSGCTDSGRRTDTGGQTHAQS